MSDPELIADLGTLRDDADGRRAVAMTRTYPVSPAQLWAAITEPEQLARWFGQVDGDVREGGAFRVTFQGGAVTPMTLQRCAAPRELEVAWTFPAEPDSVLHVTVSDAEGGAEIVLDHRLLPYDQAVGYAAGWHTYLDRLEDVLAGGSARNWDDRFAEVLQTYRGVAMR
ncbi:MAG: SRPBCC family protein [Kineosporiaceae bacterium]